MRILHGYSRHPAYRVWDGMKQRCHNPRAANYENWGGRGIVVCLEWRHNPKTFVEWALANGYTPGLHIDRIDNDGPYAPDNCRFVTPLANNMNRRCSRRHAA